VECGRRDKSRHDAARNEPAATGGVHCGTCDLVGVSQPSVKIR
jgi:hypothetical protein